MLDIKARVEIRAFVNEGLQDAWQGRFEDYREVFDRLEARYQEKEAAVV